MLLFFSANNPFFLFFTGRSQDKSGKLKETSQRDFPYLNTLNPPYVF